MTFGEGTRQREPGAWRGLWVAVGLAAAVLVFRYVIFVRLGSLLVATTSLDKADVVVVHGGNARERAPHAASLYRAGVAQRLLALGGHLQLDEEVGCPGLRGAEVTAVYLRTLEVPGKDIEALPGGKSTMEEAFLVREYLDKKDYERAVIVSSPYHLRRLRLAYDIAFRGQERTHLSFSSEEPERLGYRPKTWWRHERDLVEVVTEYLKIAHYWRTYAFRDEAAIRRYLGSHDM